MSLLPITSPPSTKFYDKISIKLTISKNLILIKSVWNGRIENVMEELVLNLLDHEGWIEFG